jgi:hypothetical protein
MILNNNKEILKIINKCQSIDKNNSHHREKDIEYFQKLISNNKK